MNGRRALGAAIGRALVLHAAALGLLAHSGVGRAEAPPVDRFADAAAAFAPIGVRAGQTYHKGEWLLSYRYIRSRFGGNRVGTRDVALAEVLAGYPLAPDRVVAETHLFTVAYAPFERLAIELDLPVERRWMRQVARSGQRVSTESTGIGDLRITAIVPFMKKGGESLHFSLGLGIPTGSISKKDPEPLPYIMQMGSGTVDLIPGLTYRGHYDWLSWGLQAAFQFHFLQNYRNYSLGSTYASTTWLAVSPFEWLCASVRVAWEKTNNVSAGDFALGPPFESPANDGGLQGGTVVHAGPGLNFKLPCCGGQRLAFEALFPVYQDLSGPQIEREWSLVAGLQWAF